MLGLGALVAVQTGMVPVGALDGAALEAQLEEDLGRTFDGSVQVDCPASIPQQKNRITDCDVRLPSGREGQVFIEQVDAGGHFRFQVESGVAAAEIEEQIEEDVETATAQAERDAAELTKQIERDTEAAVAALPRQAFVDTCEGAYTADVCDCIFDALGAKDAQDEALVGFLAEQPTAAATKAAGGCGG